MGSLSQTSAPVLPSLLVLIFILFLRVLLLRVGLKRNHRKNQHILRYAQKVTRERPNTAVQRPQSTHSNLPAAQLYGCIWDRHRYKPTRGCPSSVAIVQNVDFGLIGTNHWWFHFYKGDDLFHAAPLTRILRANLTLT